METKLTLRLNDNVIEELKIMLVVIRLVFQND